MKTNTLLQILLCLLFVGVAMQPGRAKEPVGDPEPRVYLPLFGEHETSYNIFLPEAEASITFSIRSLKDSVFNGQAYKAFMSGYGGIPILIRATEDNSKVYCYDSESRQEILTFDLTLEKGDIYTSYYSYNSLNDTWLTAEYTVDSAYTDDKGRKNVILSVDEGYISLKFIEGEGSSDGLFYNYLLNNYLHVLLCGWKDGEQSYSFFDDFFDVYELCVNRGFGNCSGWPLSLFDKEPSCEIFDSGSVDRSSAYNFCFYPNPVKDRITVEAKDTFLPSKTTVEIVDASGRICLHRNMADSTLELQVKDLPKGTYILRVLSDGKQLYSDTLLIE